MKSTYKLYGTVWDGKPINRTLFTECVHSSNFSKLSIRSLFCASTEDDVEAVIKPFVNETSIVVDMDYQYTGDNSVVATFINKRIKQILNYLSERFADVLLHKSDIKEVPSGATNTQRDQI